MALETRTYPDEVLFRLTQAGLSAAHIVDVEEVYESSTGEVKVGRRLDPRGITSDDAPLLAQISATINAAALADNAAKDAALAAAQADKTAAEQARDAAQAQVAELTAQLAALKPAMVNGVPQSVTRFQALAVLDADGLLDRVTAIMSAPETPRIAKLAWDNAQSFDRDSPTIGALAGVLGLTGPMLDDLFIAASKIKA